MAAEDTSGARPGPVVLRIKLRYDDVEAMVQRFAPNVGKSGLFLPTKSLQPVGAEVKFELRLANDKPVLVGLGKVKAIKEPDPGNPKAAFGMAIELTRVTRESRDLIMKMLERRKLLGLPETALPMPGDVDAARRSEVVETGVRDLASAAVPAAPPVVIDSEPVSSLLTAPRRQSGPLAVAKLTAVAPLAPEPPRRKRKALGEIIEGASGPVVAVTVPGLDEDVDVGAVLARARSLAGGNLDAELDALRETAAAPIEISVEAASAELARQLGGTSVDRQRDRNARWAPPPTTVSVPAAPEQLITEPSLPALEPAPPEPEPTPEPTPEPASASEPEDSEVDPEQIADEIHELEDEDLEDIEHTQLGLNAVAPDAFDQHAYSTEPSVSQDELAQRLDDQLAAAEAEAEVDDLGLAAPIATGYDDMAMDAAIAAAIQSPIFSEPADESDATNEPAEEIEPAEEAEEIDDFEILAEADEEDADLLAAHGEVDSHVENVLAAPVAEPELESEPELAIPSEPEPEPELEPVRESRPSLSDFAMRLDLDDDSLDVPHSDIDPRILSAGQALAVLEDVEDATGEDAERDDAYDPEASFTQAGQLPPDPLDLDPATADFPPLREVDHRDASEPHGRPNLAAADDGYDLESALEALDVDLDDLSASHARTELPRALPTRSSSQQHAASRPGRHRLPSEGVDVDPVPVPDRRRLSSEGIDVDLDDED